MNWTMPNRSLAAILLLACGSVGASGLQVAPIGLEFTPASPAHGLWLTNTGDKRLQAQARVFAWTQKDGKDDLAPTQAVIASPPMLNLDAGGKQLIRIIRTGPASTAGTGEESYRVLIDELPQTGQHKASGVEYVLRYSVPVFISSTQPASAASVASSLHARIEPGGDGASLVVRNDSSRHAQLSAVSLLTPDGKALEIAPGLLGYVLPGMTMHWPLQHGTDTFHPGTQLKARINGESVEQAIPLEDRPH